MGESPTPSLSLHDVCGEHAKACSILFLAKDHPMPVHPKKSYPKDMLFPKADLTNVMTARKLSKTPAFIAECEGHGVEPSIRQARKNLAGYGRWSRNRRAA